jgi:hypothetical protein
MVCGVPEGNGSIQRCCLLVPDRTHEKFDPVCFSPRAHADQSVHRSLPDEFQLPIAYTASITSNSDVSAPSRRTVMPCSINRNPSTTLL